MSSIVNIWVRLDTHIHKRDTQTGMSERMCVHGFLIPTHSSDTHDYLNNNSQNLFLERKTTQKHGESLEKIVKDLN